MDTDARERDRLYARSEAVSAALMTLGEDLHATVRACVFIVRVYVYVCDYVCEGVCAYVCACRCARMRRLSVCHLF